MPSTAATPIKRLLEDLSETIKTKVPAIKDVWLYNATSDAQGDGHATLYPAVFIEFETETDTMPTSVQRKTVNLTLHVIQKDVKSHHLDRVDLPENLALALTNDDLFGTLCEGLVDKGFMAATRYTNLVDDRIRMTAYYIANNEFEYTEADAVANVEGVYVTLEDIQPDLSDFLQAYKFPGF